ncbi:MAG: FAD-dependent oxidoreductase, partial [Cyanobacteria bacterium J06606_4]
MRRVTSGFLSGVLTVFSFSFARPLSVSAQSTAVVPDETVECEVLIVGGGLSGTSTAYESLLAGRTVCMTELTDWVGGQISSQGTSALDEAQKQRSLLFYADGYKQLRSRIEDFYGELNPGGCWVSVSCFLPKD